MSGGTISWQNELQTADASHGRQRSLFILYTAGAAGKPRGIVHTHGGMCVRAGLYNLWVFDIKDTDVYWSTADIGWITGHSLHSLRPALPWGLQASCTRALPTIRTSAAGSRSLRTTESR